MIELCSERCEIKQKENSTTLICLVPKEACPIGIGVFGVYCIHENYIPEEIKTESRGFEIDKTWKDYIKPDRDECGRKQ